MSVMKLNIIEVANKIFRNKKLIITTLPKGKIRIWYENTRKTTNPKPFVFPKFIEIDEEFAEAIGIYCGDGKTTLNDMRHTELGTKDEDIGKFMINFFRRRLSVKNKDITFEILFKEGDEDELRKKWSNMLNAPPSKFILKRKRKRFKKDVLKFQINGIIFRKIFQKLIDLSLPKLKKVPL